MKTSSNRQSAIMSQQSKVLAHRKRLWCDTWSKASLYYKGRQNKLDLSHCKSIKVEWNPLLPLASNARWFRRTIAMDKFTMNTMDKCQIFDDMHDRDEPPKMSILLDQPLNTTVLFDLRKMKWDRLVQELSLWCDQTRSSIEAKEWNAEKFGFGEEVIEKLPDLRARDVHDKSINEVNQLIFFEADQPMQPNEFFNDNKNRKLKNIDSYSYSPRMEHKYSNERSPIWRDDFEFLHKSASYTGLPHFRYDYIVYDDEGLLYPNFDQMPKYYMDKILEAQPHNDILGEYICKHSKGFCKE